MKRFVTLCVFAVILFLTGCGKKAETIVIPLRIQVSETVENKNEVVEKIYDDLRQLHEAGIPLKGYQLNVESYVKEHEKESTADWFYCTAEDVFYGDYLEPLALRYINFDMKDTWKKYACLAYFCNLEPYFPDKVVTYLSDEANKDVLSMFVGYWCADFYSEEEIERNAEVAKLYGKYIIDNYGLESLISCKAEDYVNEWLGYLGIPYSYEDPYAELLDTFAYSEGDGYRLIIETDQNLEIYATPPHRDGNDVFLLRQFLYESHQMIDEFLNRVMREAPDYYETIRHNLFHEKVRVYFDRTLLSAQGGVTMNSEIRNDSYLVFSHEICHVLLPAEINTPHVWRYDGFADYACYIIGYLSDATTMSWVRQASEEAMEDALENKSKYPEWYLDYLEKVQRALDDENATYGDYQRVEAQVDVQLGADSEYFTSLYDSYSYTYADIDKEENTQLSYRTAAFFVQHLIDKYSLNSFFQYSIDNVSFEEAFGTSFSEALKTWQEEFLQDVD